MIQIGSARALVNSQPKMTETILEELETDLELSLQDIRRLVYNLRPPVLDQRSEEDGAPKRDGESDP
jgi:signal transduction histidine kinase